jgi:hypothetical protein
VHLLHMHELALLKHMLPAKKKKKKEAAASFNFWINTKQ